MRLFKSSYRLFGITAIATVNSQHRHNVAASATAEVGLFRSPYLFVAQKKRYNNRSGATKESENRVLMQLTCATSIMFLTLLFGHTSVGVPTPTDRKTGVLSVLGEEVIPTKSSRPLSVPKGGSPKQLCCWVRLVYPIMRSSLCTSGNWAQRIKC